MANAIDLVVAQEAMNQLASLIAKLNEVDAKMLAISKNAISLGGQIGGINTPSDGAGNGKKQKGINDELATQAALNKRLSESIQLLQAKYTELTRARGNGQKTLLEEQAAVREQLRLATLEAKAVNDSYNAYQKKDAEYKKAVLAAKELGAVHGSTSAVFLKEAAAVNKLADELKAIDAKLGNHTRSVGNYASGWNGLSNSINQLTREAPAFANSMQTGFMAISNNIPILVDEINNLNSANKQLIATGGKAKSVLNSVAGALFSWQTALSVGVTLLTIYGAKIVDSITGSSKRKVALELEKKAIEEKASAEKEALNVLSKYQSEEISLSKILFEKAKNLTLTMKERLSAVKELQERYPDYLGKLSSQKILAGDTADEEQRLNAALILRGKALAAQELLAKNSLEQMKAQVEFEKISQKGFAEMQAQLNPDKSIKNLEKYNRASYESAKATNLASIELNKKLDPLKKEEAVLLSVFNANASYLDIVKSSTSINKKSSSATRDKTEEFKSELILRGGLLSQINENISQLEKEREFVSSTSEQYALFTAQIQKLIEKKKQIEKGLFVDFKIAIPDTPPTETQEKLVKSWKDTYKDIAKVAMKSSSIIAEANQMKFDAEFANLDKQKEIALKYAGDSASAKERIEQQYSEKRSKLIKKENETKKKQALFEIAINTASAVVEALPNIPLSVAVGALGLIELGVVAASEIPQYFDGGIHDGGLAMINDGGGSNYVETVVTPDGKVSQYSGRDVVTNLPKGTEIFTPEQWQEKELHNMLQSRGISMNVSKQNGGMTAQEMDMVLAKHFKKIQTTTMNIDRNGFSMFTESNGNKTIRNANRVSGTGFKI